MNRGALQSYPVQQMMSGNPIWWNINNMWPPTQHPSPFLPSSSSFLPQYPPPISLPLGPCHENQDLPDSWSQQLLGGLAGEDDGYNFSHMQSKKMDNWENRTLFPSSVHMVDVNQECLESGYVYGHGNDDFQAIMSPCVQVLPASSPRSCVTSFSSDMLHFSHTKCNSTATGAPHKKAKVQSSSTQSTFKVRKEKLGDRITALHQLVSPFGKTDTASVLLEAIGYIRFLQSQIENLSSPCWATAPSGNIRQPLLNDTSLKRRGGTEKDAVDGPKKDLRSRGLSLVPISCTLQVGNDNEADYWTPNLGGGFR